MSIEQHLLAVLALGALCVCWVLFQRWLHRVDPELWDGEKRPQGSGNCGGCEGRSPSCKTKVPTDR